MSSSSISRVLHETINSQVKAASYAVRGPLVTRSIQLKNQGKDIISCNIGNPHALNQKSVTFIRDVLSIVLNPSLKDRFQFPADIVKRSNKYLDSIPDVGVYSESQGFMTVREEVCEFLKERDGHEASPDDIFLTNGASDGVRLCLQTIIRSGEGYKDGVLIPIPQYPLYSALSTLLQAELIPYYLDENSGWECTSDTLTDSLNKAKAKGIIPRAIVVINPGNPTGQLLHEETIQLIVKWCVEHNILIMADEVYQENIWKENSKFVSFRKVAYDMNAFSSDSNDSTSGLQLISFHSISKGFLGECGLRGGYFELSGISDKVRDELIKLASISLCSNTVGQIATGLMVQPPKINDESYDLYHREKHDILESLKRRACKLSNALHEIDNITCNTIDGALYAFPTIILPSKLIEEAKSKGIEPDAMYALALLEATGIVVVPGSGFGQVEGSYHFRITILPPEDKIDSVVDMLKTFHSNYLAMYQ